MFHLAIAALLFADDAAIDAERSAWKFKRKVVITGVDSLGSVVLPPELSTNAAAGNRDLRLVDTDGREVPYLLDWTSEREGLATWRANVKDIRRERENESSLSPVRTQWTIDLGDVRPFTELHLDVPDVGFAWHARIEVSNDGRSWDVALPEASLFDQTWNGERVRKTDVRFDAPLTGRYVRITARSAADANTFELQGASVTLRQRLKGDRWSTEVKATPIEDQPSRTATRYQVGASSLLPFDEVEIVTDDASFSRRARLNEQFEARGRATQYPLGEGIAFRLRGQGTLVAGENTWFRAGNGSGGALFLDVENGSSPPLKNLRVRLRGARVRLIFPPPASPRSLWLYYGNGSTRQPAYDIEALRPRITQALGGTTGVLGAEQANTAFRPEPPLRFAAVLGASLDPSHWRSERAIAPLAAEDVYALKLTSSDLGILRPDLADLRVTTSDGRQVPFLIDADFADERITFKVSKEASAPANKSRVRLEPPQSFPANRGPRVQRLDLEVEDAFFDRQARIVRAGDSDRRAPAFFLALSRRPPSMSPLSFAVDLPLTPVVLEVDDGDNAPLSVHSATGVVRVPRVVFKAAPSSLRLLLGNNTAEAPRYDLASLRSELLAYSAVAAKAGPLQENRKAPWSLSAFFDQAPPNSLVWGAIIASVIVLGALTLRTIKNT